jgi:hypothetical protein
MDDGDSSWIIVLNSFSSNNEKVLGCVLVQIMERKKSLEMF